MAHMNICPEKKAFTVALLVTSCLMYLVTLLHNTNFFQSETVPKPYGSEYQSMLTSGQDFIAESPSYGRWKEPFSGNGPYIAPSYKTVQERQIQRTQHVKNVCTKYNITGDIGVKNITFVFSKKYNFAYFNIAKIGSTFLKQMFMVLIRGKEKAESIFNTARMHVHSSSGDIFQKLNASVIRDAFVIVPTRNPYTRLYSAYVDKVYLPISVHLAKAVGGVARNKSPCGRNQTFVDFLKYALRPVKGRILANHYDSPYKAVYMFLCGLKNFMLIQQETFSEDVELALQIAGVDKEEFDIIYEKLHGQRAEATIPGIVQTIYMHSRRLQTSCYPGPEVARRTWRAFQIQGFIHADIDFPEHEFESKSDKDLYADTDHVTQIILKYAKIRPMTSAERRAQRRDTLLEAYSTVDHATLRKIQDFYAMDFEMYQYDIDLQAVR